MWECTLRCNLNCRHCGSDCKQEAGIPDMPASHFLKALDEISPHITPEKTTIVLTGGEPLMRQDLEEIGRELYARRFPWGFVTNGMLLTAKRLGSLKRAGLRTMTISFDGLEEAHNWLRGNQNSFRLASQAIRAMSQEESIKFDVVSCVNGRNYAELPALRDWLIANNVKNWRLFTIFPIGRAKDDPELMLSHEQFRGLFDFIKETRAEGRIIARYGCEGFLGNYEGEVREQFFFCRAGINVASIFADGSISGCTSLRDNFVQGNIYTDNFQEVWEKKFKDLRQRAWTKTGICKSCEYYGYCEGNGMHLWNKEKNELLFCHLEKLKNA